MIEFRSELGLSRRVLQEIGHAEGRVELYFKIMDQECSAIGESLFRVRQDHPSVCAALRVSTEQVHDPWTERADAAELRFYTSPGPAPDLRKEELRLLRRERDRGALTYKSHRRLMLLEEWGVEE